MGEVLGLHHFAHRTPACRLFQIYTCATGLCFVQSMTLHCFYILSHTYTDIAGVAYMHTYLCTYTRTHVHAYMYMHTYMQTCIQKHAYLHSVCTCIHTYLGTVTSLHVHVCACASACTYVYAHDLLRVFLFSISPSLSLSLSHACTQQNAQQTLASSNRVCVRQQRACKSIIQLHSKLFFHSRFTVKDFLPLRACFWPPKDWSRFLLRR